MKAKTSVPKGNKPSAVEQQKPRKAIGKLPDPLFLWQDIPTNLPPITQHEIVEYKNAEWMYRTAKADFEIKHATLVFKLLTNHQVDKRSDYNARLDEDGRLVVYERCSCCNSVDIDLTRH